MPTNLTKEQIAEIVAGENFQRASRDFINSFNNLAVLIFQINEANGFWPEIPKDRNRGEAISLVHAELSEALEAYRTVTEDGSPLMDAKVPNMPAEAVEYADAIIRLMDMAVGFDLPIAESIVEKLVYNNLRKYKHGKKF